MSHLANAPYPDGCLRRLPTERECLPPPTHGCRSAGRVKGEAIALTAVPGSAGGLMPTATADGLD